MEHIGTVSREAVIDAWAAAFGRPPTKKLSTALMQAALAYEGQCRTSGGLSRMDLRRLASLAGITRDQSNAPRTRATPGTHLIREWNGRSYQVEVVKDGYALDGRTYGSLSAVAKQITGAHWSGPRFFGVSG